MFRRLKKLIHQEKNIARLLVRGFNILLVEHRLPYIVTKWFNYNLAIVKSLVEQFRFVCISRLTCTRKIQRILVKRKKALGDVLLTTPIVRRLRNECGPRDVINIATDKGFIYVGNPTVNAVFSWDHPVVGYDRVIDLDLAYEMSPKQHIIDAYSAVAFGEHVANSEYDKSTFLFVGDREYLWIDKMLSEMSGVMTGSYVVAHMGVTWQSRTWPKEHWAEALRIITTKGIKVFLVGSGKDFTISLGGVFDLTKKLNLQQIAALIYRSGCFVGNDSGMLHIAGTTRVPIVGIFTSARAKYRVPFRNGAYGWKCIALEPQVECYGCVHDEPPPIKFCGCRRGDFICLNQITPRMVSDAVYEALSIC